MKTFLTSLFLLICPLALLAQTNQIYVSATGNDTNSGTMSSPKKTIRGAYNDIQTMPNSTIIQSSYEIILKDGRDIYVSDSLGTLPEREQLIWNKSGDSSKSISIFPMNESATITRKLDTTSGRHMFELDGIDNFHIRNIVFKKSTLAFNLINVDNSSITYCDFQGGKIVGGGGSGCIITEIPKDRFDHNSWNTDSIMRSENNSFSYNRFDGLQVTEQTSKHLYQAIYLSRGTVNNTVKGNTIIGPPGSGVQFNHGFQQGNTVSKNLIYQEFENQNCSSNMPLECNRYGITFNAGKDTLIIDNLYVPLSQQFLLNTMTGNTISGNYLYANVRANNWNPIGGTRSLRYFSGATTNNPIEDNHFYYGSENDKKPFDPYWSEYNSDEIGGRTVNGDFNGDGLEDVAAFRDLGSCSAEINVWLGGNTQVLDFHQKSWWDTASYGGGYCLTSIGNRIVSGDFNDDGYDDIAVFYRYSSSNSRIHVFLSTNNGTEFQFNKGSSGWWNNQIDLGGGYPLSNVENRMVSGDFDHDGDDDIATFYKYGSCSSRIHVFKSNKAKFVFSSSASGTWWDTASYGGGYCLDAIEGRMITGDFDEDGYKDDIATFYDYGSSNARIHVFLSISNSSFQFNNGSAGWWNNVVDLGGGYSMDKIENRFVSGDFDGDGYKDDIATFYDYGSCDARIHTFLSSSNDFSLNQGSGGWWNSQAYGGGYCLNQVGDKMVAGNFMTSGASDIITFYTYDLTNTRTHLFQNHEVNGNHSFDYSGALGLPWVDIDENSLGGTTPIKARTKEFLNDESDESQVIVHPNPSMEYFNVSYNLKGPSNVKMTIYSFFGEELLVVTDEKNIAGQYNVEVPWYRIRNRKIVVVKLESDEFTAYKKVLRKD